MHVVHGTWIPDEPGAFVQGGGFYVWIETDAPPRTDAPRASAGRGEAAHPRHLAGAALGTFLAEKLRLPQPPPAVLARTLCPRWLRLPSADGAPLPSVELLPYLEQPLPERFELAWWQVACYSLPRPIASLNEIHFVALHGAEEFQLGADLLFWYQYTQALRGVLARDQYIPALAYRALGPAKAAPKVSRKASGKAPTGRGPAERFELYGGWELLSEAYEAAVRQFAACMPAVCAAAAPAPADRTAPVARPAPADTARFAPEPLLRHCAERLLHDLVAGTPFTAKIEQQVACSLLADCLRPGQPALAGSPPAERLETYTQWAAWREKLAHAQTTARFTLCLRLEEAPLADAQDWRIHFLVAARDDPSFQVPLADYWRLPPAGRARLVGRFGPAFERDLLLALGSAARIYPRIWDGLETDQPVGLRLTLDEAFAFLQERAWVLEDAGYRVMVPAWWTPEGRRRVKLRLKTSPRKKGPAAAARAQSAFSLETLVEYQYQLSIDGQPVSEQEWRQLVAAKTPLVQLRGQWMALDRERMQQLLEFWQTRQQQAPELSLLDLLKTATEAEEDLEWDHDPALGELLAKLHDKSALEPRADPPNLRGTLREYQRRGLAWLRYLESLGLNPCLADDMGLGKTVQVIARLVEERNESHTDQVAPTLLVAPTSVLGNWRKEIERFAPHLRALVHQGAERLKDERAFVDAACAHDVVITSFALARLDEKLLRSVEWRRLVVDEAQNIKNPQAAQTRALTKVVAHHRLALTGTPVENRLLDLWSIFNFLHPGYLGKEAQFRRAFETPIQKEHDLARAGTLKKLVEPFVLRRLKTDKRIIDDLPEKVEQAVFCTLTREQASLYEAVVKDVAEALESAEGIQRRGMMLATLLKLKQICNHPAQFLQDGSDFAAERSHKLQRLGEMLAEVIESGESALVFTQFTEIGGALEKYLARTLRHPLYYLHGGTSAPRREQLVAAFQDPDGEPSVFVLSLRAGGVGLNLTRANHVFHFDRWWNPAVEDQATDRAFRIGQRKNVFVHKFVAIGTLEERIDQMIQDKKQLSSTVVGSDESWLTELDNETFKELIALQRAAVVE